MLGVWEILGSSVGEAGGLGGQVVLGVSGVRWSWRSGSGGPVGLGGPGGNE